MSANEIGLDVVVGVVLIDGSPYVEITICDRMMLMLTAEATRAFIEQLLEAQFRLLEHTHRAEQAARDALVKAAGTGDGGGSGGRL